MRTTILSFSFGTLITKRYSVARCIVKPTAPTERARWGRCKGAVIWYCATPGPDS